MSLGGGLGPLGRTFGFSADHVRAFRLTGWDGSELEITAQTDSDVFSSLRGAP